MKKNLFIAIFLSVGIYASYKFLIKTSHKKSSSAALIIKKDDTKLKTIYGNVIEKFQHTEILKTKNEAEKIFNKDLNNLKTLIDKNNLLISKRKKVPRDLLNEIAKAEKIVIQSHKIFTEKSYFAYRELSKQLNKEAENEI